MLIVLVLILIVLMLLVGGDKTAKSLVTLSFNCFILLCTIFAINMGLNPLISTVISCVVISLITLFYQNDINIKTKVAFISVLIVIAILFLLIFKIVSMSNIQGFPQDQLSIQDSNGYSRNISRNMMYIQISVILMVFIGAIIDTALAVASALYEIHLNNPDLSKEKIFESGIHIGRDILSSTVHTLFFIYIAEYLTLFIQFVDDSTFVQMINSKEFCQEFISIALSGVGCVLIIPITAFLGSWFYKRHKIAPVESELNN
ncbi:YibE/F family protein [Aminipila luticellarii]|uniref:YibE/F family protein n=1 Tax=Aminipila luticellarii TaxID=2507160 RepID=A0A410PWQ1_9FIRM|nr:YibE/F family protein [Aminipila luticellarii]QAT43369.1 YibE/F family protein [Aminipila luticellarii]